MGGDGESKRPQGLDGWGGRGSGGGVFFGRCSRAHADGRRGALTAAALVSAGGLRRCGKESGVGGEAAGRVGAEATRPQAQAGR